MNSPSGLRTAGPVMVQPYLHEAADGNKRIFLLDGEPVAAVNRYLPDGDFRIKHPAEAAPLTGRDRESADAVDAVLTLSTERRFA